MGAGRESRNKFSIAAVVVLMATITAASAQPAQIILIRHAEKPKDPTALHLSPAGEERARKLVVFVKNSPDLSRFGLPVALYASEMTHRGHGQRTTETLESLSRELGVSILSPFKSDEYEKLAKAILSNPDYNGKTVMICWTHEFIPQLAKALGCKPAPPKLAEDVYDRVYLVTYTGRDASLRILKQDFATQSSPPKNHPKKHRFG
jgi:hypothetical protein